MAEADARRKFRKLLADPHVILSPGVWDPFSARVAEWVGLKCVHLGGYEMGAVYATSEPLLTLTEIAISSRYTAGAVQIPVIVDAGAGFGEPLHVMRTIREIERSGAAGLHIEDQIYPKRVHYHRGEKRQIKHVISRREMLDKIRAAVTARADPDFILIGRTDSMNTDGFAEGVERANLFLEAGADMVMVFPNTVEEAHRAPQEIKGPVCYVNSDGNRFGYPVFTTQQFEDMGYKMITGPLALIAMKEALKEAYTNLLSKGGSVMSQEKAIRARKEIEDIIGLDVHYKVESETVEPGAG